MERTCKKHGLTEFGATQRGKGINYYCKKCNVESVANRRRRLKAELVEEHGGCCAVCGYNKSLRALHFHHVDPSSKKFAIALNRNVMAMAKLREEAKKCVLVCHNCHDEIEDGITECPSLD